VVAALPYRRAAGGTLKPWPSLASRVKIKHGGVHGCDVEGRLVLQIVHYPHPALRYLSRPVSEIDDTLRSIVRTMFDLMYAAKGVGLAANQVGLPFRFFILNVTADPEKREQEQVFINPQIVKRHASVEDEEGCLSIPGVYAKVRRARKIRVQAFDLKGSLFELDAEELLSRAIQHETDHVEGKLFIDYLDDAARRSIAEHLREFELQYSQGQFTGAIPPDEVLMRRLRDMERPSATAGADSSDATAQTA
jgi:peptide deformylase